MPRKTGQPDIGKTTDTKAETALQILIDEEVQPLEPSDEED